MTLINQFLLINSIICFIYLLPQASHPKITHSAWGGHGTSMGSAGSQPAQPPHQQLCLPPLPPSQPHLIPPAKEQSPVTTCFTKASLNPRQHKVRLRGKLLAPPAATPGFRLTSGCWRCQALGRLPLLLGAWRGWETLRRGCPSLRSRNLVSRFSYLKNKLPTPLTKLCLAIPLAHYKEKSWFALLDLLNLGSSLHQFAEQGCLVLKHQWFMVSHVLMGYIIHLVLVFMNISSWDRSACWGVGWRSAVC